MRWSGCGSVHPAANHGVTVRKLVPRQLPIPRLGLFAGVLTGREPSEEGVAVRGRRGLARLLRSFIVGGRFVIRDVLDLMPCGALPCEVSDHGQTYAQSHAADDADLRLVLRVPALRLLVRGRGLAICGSAFTRRGVVHVHTSIGPSRYLSGNQPTSPDPLQYTEQTPASPHFPALGPETITGAGQARHPVLVAPVAVLRLDGSPEPRREIPEARPLFGDRVSSVWLGAPSMARPAPAAVAPGWPRAAPGAGPVRSS